jgi:hypothetical protein
MSNELTTDLASLTNLPVSVTAARTNLAKRATETEWLQRIQLVTKGKYVELDKIRSGHYGVPLKEDEIQDLGDSIDILPLAVRDKALDTTEDPPLTNYDASSAIFQDIEERSSEKDSGCMWGPSFLVFERNTGKFYEFFCGNKSARAEAGKFEPFLPISEAEAEQFGCDPKGPDPITLTAKHIRRPRFSWHVPEVHECSTPFTNLPPVERIVQEIQKFLNPKTQDAELVEEGERSR